jgi:uncharacterized protein YndB with AHSA1/START domain
LAETVTISDDGPMVRAVVWLDGCTPGQALAAFTEPALLARWWGGELTAELSPGGQYSVWFRKIPARMTGQVVSYTPERSLAFSWGWEHQTDRPQRTVLVQVEPAEPESSGTLLTIEHGPHGADAAELTARAEHREGWQFFLPRLVGVLTD